MLTSIDVALPEWLAQAKPTATTDLVAIREAVGRILAHPIVSPIDVPPWDNSAMDGYAVRACDIAKDVPLRQSQYITAGSMPSALEPNTCARIFTGAPVPPGADAIIMQENATAEGDFVSFSSACHVGDNIRRQAQDMSSSQAVFAQGRRLSAADVGVLATLGIADVEVFQRIKIALVSSGDELCEPGTPLRLGQIYNSNTYGLSALLTSVGCDVVFEQWAADTVEATRDTLTAAAAVADIVISSGGASVGDADYMLQVLGELGAVQTWKLAIKPGKPLMFGDVDGTPFFGLPGNPSSAFVTCLIAVLPFIETVQGCTRPLIKPSYAVADFDWLKSGSRQEYLRVQTYFDGVTQRVRLYPNQSSGIVLSTSWANALAVVPIGQSFEAGAVVEVLPLP